MAKHTKSLGLKSERRVFIYRSSSLIQNFNFFVKKLRHCEEM